MLISFYAQDSSWSLLWENNIIMFACQIKGEDLQEEYLAMEKQAKWKAEMSL